MLFESVAVSHARRVRALIEPRVRRVVADQLAVDSGALRDSISIRHDLAADSLDLLELALVLEGEFAVALPDSAIDGMRSYGDVVEVIVARVAAVTTAVRAPQTVR
jgi:acyl carrier protein